MDQPGVVAWTSSEEVKRRENDTFPVLVRARECRLARQVRRSRPASYGIPPHTSQLVRRANCPCCSRVTCLRTGELENCAIHFNGFLGFKAALHTIVPRSLFFAFCTHKILPVTKMRLNVCFNETALFGPFAALIKGCSSYGRNGGQPTKGDGQPARNGSVHRWESWAS